MTMNFLKQPCLRDGVLMTLQEESCEIQYRENIYAIDLAPHAREDSSGFLQALQKGGQTADSLMATFPAVKNEVVDILRELDRLGLLTETAPQPAHTISGRQFFRELLRYVGRVKRRYATSAFYKGLVAGTVSRDQILGYAIEYYHVVRMCPGLLAPALAIHETTATQKALMRFFISELRHDEMLARSLQAVDIPREKLDLAMPLPMTFALLSSLGVYARQHPLSFKASLFIFEQPDDAFNEALQKRCEDVDLPAAFYEPILHHSTINEEVNHDKISEVLFDDVPCVSREEQIVVKRHVGLMVESMILMEQQMLNYYGNPDNPRLRCYQ